MVSFWGRFCLFSGALAASFRACMFFFPRSFLLAPKKGKVMLRGIWQNLSRWWIEICVFYTPTWGNDPIWFAHIFPKGWRKKHQHGFMLDMFFRKKLWWISGQGEPGTVILPRSCTLLTWSIPLCRRLESSSHHWYMETFTISNYKDSGSAEKRGLCAGVYYIPWAHENYRFFGHLKFKTRCFSIKPSKNIAFGGPMHIHGGAH